MTRKAFTLIEVLVVITVRMMLMGMLVPAVIHVRKTAVRKLAATRLKGLALAIERYFLQVGNYPPSTGFPGDALWDDTDPQLGKYSLYWHLCGPGGDGIDYEGKTYGPYMDLDESQYVDDGAGRFILDPWGKPWIYQENRVEYMRVVHEVDYRAHKVTRYDILCMGANGLVSAANLYFYNRAGEPTGEEDDDDDITNWD